MRAALALIVSNKMAGTWIASLTLWDSCIAESNITHNIILIMRHILSYYALSIILLLGIIRYGKTTHPVSSLGSHKLAVCAAFAFLQISVKAQHPSNVTFVPLMHSSATHGRTSDK